MGLEEGYMNKSKELSPWEKTCLQRIKKIIDDYCDGSQQRFVERTGLNKGSVSQYVNGKNVPSTSNAQKIADAFNIDVGWILAYDAIPPGADEDPYEMAKAKELYALYQNLTPEARLAFETLLKNLQSASDPRDQQ